MLQVSVVIPTFNYARYLGEAIESVLAQTYPAYEIIVVDDGSTDDTPAVVERYAGKIRGLRIANGGVSRARNTGVAAATGDLIAFLDADDHWQPRKLELQIATFLDHPNAGLIHTGSHVYDQGTGTSLCVFSPNRTVDLAELIRCCSVSASSVMVPRAILKRVGHFDEKLVGTEDWDMWLRIALDHPVVGCPEVLVDYRSHEQSLSSNAHRQFQNSMAVLAKAEQLHSGDERCRKALGKARTQMRREYFRKLTSLGREAFREGRIKDGWNLRAMAMWNHPGFLWDLPDLFRERAKAREAAAAAAAGRPQPF